MSDKMYDSQPKSIICPNCGGEYASWSLKCPYCGSVNDAGAERAYMEHMEELRNRLDSVDEESDEIYRSSMSGTLKWALRIAGMAILVAVLMAGVFLWHEKSTDRRMEKHMQGLAAWQEEEFPKLDTWYAAGDYQAILEEYRNLITSNSDYNIYDWPHANFITNYYSAYSCIKECQDNYDGASESMAEFYLGEAIHGVLTLCYETNEERIGQQVESFRYNGMHGLLEEEVELIRGYQAEAREFMHESLGWSDERGQVIFDELADEEGYLSISKCFDYAKQVKKP